MPDPDWCIVQADNRAEEDLKSQADLMELNRMQCKLEGTCDVFQPTTLDVNKTSPYWLKVNAMRECLDSNCGACIYIDTDAVINPNTWRGTFDDLLGSAEVGFTPDWGRDRFNAGVFAFRATDRGRAIVDQWLGHEPTDRWSRNADGTWDCTQDDGKKCPWAGSAYEQGTFIHNVLPTLRPEEFHEASPHAWNNDLIGGNSCFLGQIKHFAGDYSNIYGKGTGGKEIAIRRFLDECNPEQLAAMETSRE